MTCPAPNANPIIQAWHSADCDERCEFLAHLRGRYTLSMIEDFWRTPPRNNVGAALAPPNNKEV